MKKKKEKGGFLKIFIIVIAIIVIFILGIVFWQKENIKALVDATKYSGEDIESQIEENKESVEKELEQYNVSGLRDFTPEEEEAIRKGTLTVEEAIEKIISESNNNGELKDENLPENNSNVSNIGENGEDKVSQVVSEYTVRLYSLKATYLGKIGNLIDQAKADYKGGMGASALMSKYLSRANSLEKEADSKVNSLLSELEKELNSLGADTSIIGTMRKSYESEKTLKKSYYISLFNKKK